LPDRVRPSLGTAPTIRPATTGITTITTATIIATVLMTGQPSVTDRLAQARLWLSRAACQVSMNFILASLSVAPEWRVQESVGVGD
jgi:hypothetical protein